MNFGYPAWKAIIKMTTISPRARQSSSSGNNTPLPDFETLLANKGSTIRVRASEDRQLGSDTIKGRDVVESPPPTPPRKGSLMPSSIAEDAARRIGSSRNRNGSDSNGRMDKVLKGREAAMRDIEREMSLQEQYDSDDGHYGSSQEGAEAAEEQQQSLDQVEGDHSKNANNSTITEHQKKQDPNGETQGGSASTTTTFKPGHAHRISGSMPLPSSSSSPSSSSTSGMIMNHTSNSNNDRDKALPMSPPDMLEHDLRRRSQFRSTGTATSPDLATLVKNAKAAAALAATNGSTSSSTINDSSNGGTQGTSSAVNKNDNRGSPRSRVSSDLGSRRVTPSMPTVSSLQAAMESSSLSSSPPRARAISTLSDSGTSFVHVNHGNNNSNNTGSNRSTIGGLSASPYASLSVDAFTPAGQPILKPTIDSELGKITSISNGGGESTGAGIIGSGSSRRSRKLTKNADESVSGSGCLYRLFPLNTMSHHHIYLDARSTFLPVFLLQGISNAMRKTSGFFRKTFGTRNSNSNTNNNHDNYLLGSSSIPSQDAAVKNYPNNTLSAPSTPTTTRFSTFENDANKPPVPTIPSTYSQSTLPHPRTSFELNSAPGAGPSTPNTAPRIGIGRQNRSSSQISSATNRPSPAKSFGRLSSFASSFRSSDNKSTSDLQLQQQQKQQQASSISGTSSSSYSDIKKSTSTQSTEQERLARELNQWRGYEENLEMLNTSPEKPSVHGDIPNNTIRAPSTPAKSPGRMFMVPQTPPSNNSNNHSNNSSPSGRTRSGSNSVLMSGSIPSPSMRGHSPRPKTSDTLFLSGSIPSPQQAQRNFRAANNLRTSSVDTTGGSQTSTSTTSATAMRYPTTAGPRSMSESHSGRGKLSVNSSSGSSSPAFEESARLSPYNGRPARTRSTSNSASPTSTNPTNAGPGQGDGGDETLRTPTVRLVASPKSPDSSRSNPTYENGEASSRTPATNSHTASVGLGLGIGIESSDGNEIASSDSNHRSPSRTGDLPKLVTHSPSPAPTPTTKAHGLGSAYSSPTPNRSSVLSSPTTETPATLEPSPATTEGGLSSRTGSEDNAASLAERCWQEDETFLKKEKIAEWLGGHASLNQASLKFYLRNFDFKGLKLEMAFRRLCEKLYLRAETQQIDRILAEFSARYLEDNPDSIFQTKDIVHAVTYAMLLLNTDLHVADVTNRMSRSDFIFNTMSAIHAQNSNTPSIGGRTPGVSNTPTLDSSNVFFGADAGRASSLDQLKDGAVAVRFRPKRSGSASANSSRTGGLNDPNTFGDSTSNLPAQTIVSSKDKVDEPDTSAPPNNVRANSMPAMGVKAWETELENALKDIYVAVRSRAIMQPLAYSQLAPPSGSNSPYSSWNGSVNRTPSRRSQSSLGTNDRSVNNKRASIRGLLGPSHESLRATSPTPSVGTSLSGGYSGTPSFGSTMTSATTYYPPTMGFASNLTNTIIKEQQEDDAQSEASDVSTTDEELALLGAPWAKEGILQRKHYWETPNKRSKDKNWMQVFTVISKGEMKMFQFGGSGAGMSSGGGVGGGNWLTNAHVVGDVRLAHSLSSAMPPPGYNRSRPHVLVLTLASGGSYFFQAGTEDLVNEWVLTCNYWAGRTSKEPLMGGVSNMDYGWNRVAGAAADAPDDTEDLASVRSGKSGHSRRSRMSYTGSMSRQFGMGHDTGMDRVMLHDWRQPQPPSGFSTLSEDAQYDSLRKHTLALQTELEKHNELRLPALKLVSNILHQAVSCNQV